MELSVKQPYSLYRWNSDDSSSSSFSDESASFSDIVFGFFDETPNSSCSSSSNDFPDDDEEEENSGDLEEKKRFWETQNDLLRATLYRTSTLETKIRQDTKQALIEIEKIGLSCVCPESDVGCRNCLRREVSVWLQSQGHNCAICKSKWKASGNDILPGEHSYLEVVEDSKRGEVRVIIELNFKAEFTMARASQDYSQLIGRLPEVFVGRVDRMKTLIKILCSAAKACMKEKKIHLAPWRKHKYMQSKWLGKCERFVPAAALPTGQSRRRPAKARASMLTYDLLENGCLTGGGMHLTAVKV
ncbi:hypothetical protein LINGRAHAP2_LOCUS18726 [Linum grandiflorum]